MLYLCHQRVPHCSYGCLLRLLSRIRSFVTAHTDNRKQFDINIVVITVVIKAFINFLKRFYSTKQHIVVRIYVCINCKHNMVPCQIISVDAGVKSSALNSSFQDGDFKISENLNIIFLIKSSSFKSVKLYSVTLSPNHCWYAHA